MRSVKWVVNLSPVARTQDIANEYLERYKHPTLAAIHLEKIISESTCYFSGLLDRRPMKQEFETRILLTIPYLEAAEFLRKKKLEAA